MSNAREVLADVLSGTAPKRIRQRDHAAEEAGRTTVALKLRLRPEVVARADEDAATYGMDRSAYIGSLVLGQELPSPPPFSPVSDTMLLTLAGNTVMRAIADVTKRLEAGEADAPGMLAELQAIRREIVKGHLSLRADYDAMLDARKAGRSDRWSDNETHELPRKRSHGRPA